MAAAEQAQRPMLEHAVTYLHAGLPVFPVCSPLMIGHQHRDPDTLKLVTCSGKELGKTPLVRWRGYQNELPSEDDVRIWWKRWPDANIGMATGILSGILVLDADGTEARKACLQNGGLDETPMVWTGKIGGAHFHLAYPGGDVRNFARKMPGTDMRGQGGYVLMPPSLHASGNTYRWNESTRHFPYAAVPDWLTTLIESDDPSDGESAFGDDFDISEVLTGIPEGKRDDTLYRYACRLRHDDVPQAEAEELLRLAARACIPAFDEAVAVGKVRRAYKEFEPAKSPSVTFDEEIRPLNAKTTLPTPEAPPPDVFTRPISELLAMPEEEPDWMVDQLFTVGSNGWVAAEPKVGKSWVVLELAYALSTASPFLGQFAVKQPRVVLYVQEEDSLQRVLRRLKRIIKGDATRRDPPDEYFRWSVRAGFRLDNLAWLEKLRLEIETYKAEVVILDVFNRLHGSDENKQAEMTMILNNLTRLTQDYGCSFIIVHHNRKPQQGNEARGNQMMRGSGVLAGWGECSLFLKRSKEKDTIIVTPESKDAPEMDDFTIVLQDQANGGIFLQIGESAPAENLSKGDADAIDAVRRITKHGIGATVQAVAKELDKDRTTIQRRLTKLVEAGYLTSYPISDAPKATHIYEVVEQ